MNRSIYRDRNGLANSLAMNKLNVDLSNQFSEPILVNLERFRDI